MKYVCELCGWIYDEAAGDEKHGIPAGTVFSALPEDYECPGCGSEKEAFSPKERTVRNTAVRRDDRVFWNTVKYSDGNSASDR